MINTCALCNKDFPTGDRRNKHCSKACASDSLRIRNKGRSLSNETKQKISEALTGRHGGTRAKIKNVKERMSSADRLDSAIAGAAKRSERRAKLISEMQWDELTVGLRFKRVKEQQQNACNKCKNSEWMGGVLVLEIEHRDGNTRNNTRENLEALCPNCHSQTLTWRGRNARVKVSDEEMLAALREYSSITQALTALGMAAKGGNFARAKKLMGMPEGTKLSRAPGGLVDFK